MSEVRKPPPSADYRERVSQMSAADKRSNIHGEVQWIVSGYGGQVIEAGAVMDAMLAQLVESIYWLAEAGFLTAAPVEASGSPTGATE